MAPILAMVHRTGVTGVRSKGPWFGLDYRLLAE